MDLVGIELADLDQLLHFRHANLAATGDHRVEIPRRFPVDEIARFVALPRFHERDLGLDAGFEHVFRAGENFRLLALGQFRGEPRAGVKPRDSRAPRAQPLRQRPLRNQLQIEFAREHLTLEFLVLADVGSHHLLHLPRRQQHAHAEAIHARIVADNREPRHAAVVQCRDQIFRDATKPEAARGDRHVVVQQAVEGSLGVGVNFAHVEAKSNHGFRRSARMNCRPWRSTHHRRVRDRNGDHARHRRDGTAILETKDRIKARRVTTRRALLFWP